MSDQSDTVGKGWPPWLTPEALSWRPPIPPEYQKRYTWGDLKRLERRRRDVSRNPEAVQEGEFYRVSEELCFASYAMMGFSPKPLAVHIAQWFGFGLLASAEELWYQALAWEYHQWKWHVRDRGEMKPVRAEFTFIKAMLEVLPVFRAGQFERTAWDEVSLELEVLWRWLVLRGRHLSDSEFKRVAWHCFTISYWPPRVVVYHPHRRHLRVKRR